MQIQRIPFRHDTVWCLGGCRLLICAHVAIEIAVIDDARTRSALLRYATLDELAIDYG
jgi:hypothetical protein